MRETRALPNRFARARPQFRIELRLCTLGHKIDISILTHHREHRRTRPRHQRRAHLGLAEQPHLQLRQKNKLLDNGMLQIVYEGLISELLGRVWDTGNFSGILPV